jgi:hypothetical protein
MLFNQKPTNFSHFFAYEIEIDYDYNNHNEVHHRDLDKLVKKFTGILIEEDSMPYHNNRILDKLFYKFPYNNTNFVNFINKLKDINYPYKIYKISILYKTIENHIEKYLITNHNINWLSNEDRLLYNYIIKK